MNNGKGEPFLLKVMANHDVGVVFAFSGCCFRGIDHGNEGFFRRLCADTQENPVGAVAREWIERERFFPGAGLFQKSRDFLFEFLSHKPN